MLQKPSDESDEKGIKSDALTVSTFTMQGLEQLLLCGPYHILRCRSVSNADNAPQSFNLTQAESID